MWPWIKRWRDWVMNDSPLYRSSAQAQSMHYSYEKGGLVIDNQPIPWNAETVVVECQARLPAAAGRRKEDFLLRIPGAPPIVVDELRREEREDRHRLFFRFRPPSQSTAAEVVWRHHRLGELTLPVLNRAEFLQKLTLQHPTLAVDLGGQSVACQTFVSTQCRGFLASAVLTSPTSLAPLIDADLHVDFRPAGADAGKRLPLWLSSSQLKGKQALLVAAPPKLRRTTGTFVASWKIGDDVLATQKIKAISKGAFLRSLRISETRLVLQNARGEVKLDRQLVSREGLARIGPCFLVSSSEPGMAALCLLRVHAQFAGGFEPPLLLEQEILITDGPAPFVPGTLDASELTTMLAFELRAANRSLGILPLTPAPVAAFDAEGGFKAPPEYIWSTAAEDQLQERLAKLLEPRGNGRQ
jgi:hypothetical protein